ncbi:MAG: hypothetical protein EU533_05185 [Promethearchaeota archaeon]|nr:MAG: hypothetical protein EU533_05185 [Candidatus Lokiarchaeota archaeon]
MDNESNKYILLRSFVFLLSFLVLHFAYDWFPTVIIGIFSGVNEAVWQHMKIGFYSYLIIILIECALFRKKISNRTSFFFSKIFMALLYPWVMFILFFVTRIIYPWEFPEIVEIITAIIITYVSGVFSGYIELDLAKIQYGRRLKVLIIILAIFLVIEFTAFTFYLPWHDVLADPYV